jgi:hypothetical protein
MHVCPRLDADADVPVPHAAQLPNWPPQMLMDAPPPPAPYFMHPHFVLCIEVRRAGSVSTGYLGVPRCSTQTRCVASLDSRAGFRPLLILLSILLLCCTPFELILRSRSDRASNDTSICPRPLPTPTRRGPPRTLSSDVAVSSPCRLMSSQTDANTECMLSRDAGSLQTGNATVRVVLLCRHVSTLPPRRDLMANAVSLAAHGVSYPEHPSSTNGIPAVAVAVHQAITVRIEVILAFSNEGSSSRVSSPSSSWYLYIFTVTQESRIRSSAYKPGPGSWLIFSQPS